MQLVEENMLRSTIEKLQNELNALCITQTASYEEILKLSEDLDKLIVHYQRFLLETHQENMNSLFCA